MLNWVQARGLTVLTNEEPELFLALLMGLWKGNLLPHLSSCVLWIRFSSNIFALFSFPLALSGAIQPWHNCTGSLQWCMKLWNVLHQLDLWSSVIAHFLSSSGKTLCLSMLLPLWNYGGHSGSHNKTASAFSRSVPHYSPSSKLWKQIVWPQCMKVTLTCIFRWNFSQVCVISWIYGSWTPIKVKIHLNYNWEYTKIPQASFICV